MRSFASRTGFGRLATLAGGVVVLMALMASSAMAQGPGLPLGYQVQRIDSPSPALSATFGIQTVPIGDVNGDGEDDFATNQTEGTTNAEGRIWVYSGETGLLIGGFNAPEAGNPTDANNNNRALVDRWMDRLGDIGSCSANTPAGQICTSPTVGPPDGRQDFLVGAEGVDVTTPGAATNPVKDVGRVYVIDGATLSVLKRIDMPIGDRLLIAQRAAQFSTDPAIRGGFGRTAVTPRGLPVCQGNGGVTACPSALVIPPGVRAGDTDVANEVQRVVVDATSGTFTLTFDGQTTVPIAFNAPATGAGSVKEALDALANLEPSETIVTRTGSGPFTYSITFVGPRQETNVPQMTAADVSLAGGGDSVTVTTLTQGVPANQPEIVIGANRFTEIRQTAQTNSHCAATPPDDTICREAGRAYVYRGEEVAGSNPAEILDGSGPGETPPKVIKNLGAQSDLNDTTFARTEIFGHAQFPIGDIGACRSGPPFPVVAPGDRCTTAARTNVQDGKPDMIISAHRADGPIYDPDPSRYEEGFSFMVDGATGAFLHVIHHPEPHPNALFGYTTRQSFAPGDLFGTSLPDMLQAGWQNYAGKPAAGKLFGMNGDFNQAFPVFAALEDPTPMSNARFGVAREAVGDLVGANVGPELLVGVFPSNVGFQDSVTDMHFVNARSGQELQRIPDPDQQLESSFGYQVSPLGDLNEDGFLDFATAAPTWDSPGTGGAAGITNVGRIYVYRSNNAAPPPAGGGGGGTTAPTRRTYVTPGTPATGTLAGCGAGKRLLSLTAGNDNRNGTAAADLILGGSGNDTIDALAGDDCIDLGLGTDRGAGGLGNDLVLGGGGTDRLLGNAGNDRLRGGSGRDTILGAFGNDRMHGQSGNDSVTGSRGRDRINGGSGRDRLGGGSGVDRVSGDAGNDRISGNSGNDVLKGNSGNDVITGGSGRDRISCGRGRDRVIAGRGDRVARDCERVRRRR